jgi:heat shock protein HslJ
MGVISEGFKELRVDMARIPAMYAAVLTGCLGLVACGGSAANEGEVSLEQLNGVQYSSTAISEAGVPRPLASEAPITITFTEDGISANAGCNTLFGSVSISDNTLIVNQAIASSMMMCEEALMNQDEWLTSVLTGSPQVFVNDDGLTLQTPDTTITFQPVE